MANAAWQLVLVLWGEKYPVADVNRLIGTILAHAAPAPARVTLLTDRPRPGLRAGVEVKGAEIVDRKGRRLIWSEAAPGPVKARLTDYYRSLIDRPEANR